MHLPSLSLDWNVKPDDFVHLWSRIYAYPQEHLYTNTISKRVFMAEDMKTLFLWKNRTRLSAKKASALKRITGQLAVINQLKSDFNMDMFQSVFRSVAPIWKIFLLHTIVPHQYPIFDQHVFRAFYFLEHRVIREIPNIQKETIYCQDYLPFFNELAASCTMSRKKIDEALWVFGKFLKTEYGNLIYSSK